MPSTDQIVTWLVIGAVAGAAAGSLTRRDLTLGQMIVAGLIGAVFGGFLVNSSGIELPDLSITVTLADLISAIIGAVVLTVIAEAIIGRRRS
jgi:uncharacterized membrane protein YeaQ/YmgE (transglycosylase-associated protein family)